MPHRSTYSSHFGQAYEDYSERGKESCRCVLPVEKYPSLALSVISKAQCQRKKLQPKATLERSVICAGLPSEKCVLNGTDS